MRTVINNQEQIKSQLRYQIQKYLKIPYLNNLLENLCKILNCILTPKCYAIIQFQSPNKKQYSATKKLGNI